MQHGRVIWIIVKFLTLKMHCDPTSRSVHNATALHVAVEGGHLDIVRFFISDQNCDSNIPGQDGETPLHYAAEFGHLHMLMDCSPSYQSAALSECL